MMPPLIFSSGRDGPDGAALPERGGPGYYFTLFSGKSKGFQPRLSNPFPPSVPALVSGRKRAIRQKFGTAEFFLKSG